MKKRLWAVGGFMLVAVISVGVVLLLRPSGEKENKATVIEAVNKVDAHPHPKDDWLPAAVGMVVYGGGQVRTGGASSARLELLEGIVRLSADSVFTVKESVTRQGELLTTLFLREGRLWAHVTTGQPHEFTVETGDAVAAVRDTRFSVKVADGETLVSVAAGKVELTAQERSVTVVTGEQATVAPDQPPSQPKPMSDEERALWATEGEMPELAPPTPTVELPPGPPAAAIPFRDDFDGTLADGWTWLNEDPTHWNLTDLSGSLRIVLQTDAIGKGTPKNLLLRDAPASNFEMATLVRFTPTSNFQLAGLLIYYDKFNALQFGRAFCDAPEVCVGDGIYFDNIQSGEMSTQNYAMAAANQAVAYLRLQREGAIYTGYYSQDGVSWTMIGQHTRDLQPTHIGLIAAQAYEAEAIADFDYFAIQTTLSSTPSVAHTPPATTPTPTVTSTPSPTPTSIPTPTETPTSTPLPTATSTHTPTPTSTATPTPSYTPTVTPTPTDTPVEFSMKCDVNSYIWGPSRDPASGYPETVMMGSIEDSRAAQVAIEFPSGEVVVLPLSGVFGWPERSFHGQFPGLPVAGGTYTCTFLDVGGTPIAGAVASDVYVGGYIPDPPNDVRAEVTETGIQVTWDPSPAIPGAFDTTASPPLGHYHISVAEEEGGSVYIWTQRQPLTTTSYLIPFRRQNFGPADVGLAVEEWGDGVYTLAIHAASIAPDATAGQGMDGAARNPAEDWQIVIEGGQVRVEKP